MTNTRKTNKHQLTHKWLLIGLSGLLLSCGTYNAQKIGPTQIRQAQQEIPEEQLLDVGIVVFDSRELTDKQAEKEGTHPDIRKAEMHFLAYHLKNTLQQSSHWGAVRVVPAQTDGVDLTVTGTILESHGQRLVVDIQVLDASGQKWMQRTYQAEASESFFEDTVPGEKDAYQDLYNTIANDIAEYKIKLPPDSIREIRTISRLKYAAGLAPDAFDGYLDQDSGEALGISRLPSDDDPMMERVLKIRDREYMYVDTLNRYYEDFYIQMWPSYENWRKMNLSERKAYQKIKRDAIIRQIAGALMMAGAIAMDVGDVHDSPALTTSMVIIGGQVMVSGFNISKEAEIHAAAIQELGESFGAEMEPVIMEFEGQEYKLTGSAEEQFKRWREILRDIYYGETGFSPEIPAAGPEN